MASWIEQQSHRLDDNTKLICRYHRLSTHFELLLQQNKDVLICQVQQVQLEIEKMPPTLWYKRHLFYLPKHIELTHGARQYQLRIFPFPFFWRARLRCAVTSNILIEECLVGRKRRSMVRAIYFSLINLLRVMLQVLT
ncbi:hypothetical protein SAMN05421840_103129 [Shewanella morhuae]|uniref:hypothetical protein n=1 Tax=Shewanella morhuae TaxID=365591 RepID=UPI000956229F|nr:hypothetical protein [Shewanella morhuae]SIQ67893.1 hypothetical protein SAMN05421840_103129 [Shewanella morhuae]